MDIRYVFKMYLNDWLLTCFVSMPLFNFTQRLCSIAFALVYRCQAIIEQQKANYNYIIILYFNFFQMWVSMQQVHIHYIKQYLVFFGVCLAIPCVYFSFFATNVKVIKLCFLNLLQIDVNIPWIRVLLYNCGISFVKNSATYDI